MVVNPLSGLIDGLLQGHALATQIHQQQQADQAFKTQQILENQRMSAQDVMNRQMLQESAVPVGPGGTVENPAVPGQPSPVPGLPDEPGMGSFVRKVDPSRLVKYKDAQGQETQYELRTPEEQNQIRLQRQVANQNALTEASNAEQMRTAQATRNNTMKLEGGGIPATGLTSVGVPDGALLTRAEFTAMTEAAQKIRDANLKKLTPGENLVDVSSLPGVAGTAAAPGAPGAPRIVATGGPPLPTGEFATVYLPKYLQSIGKTRETATKEDIDTALSQFKAANTDPEMREATLASKAAANASRELADTMRRIQIGQQPTQEDAARLAQSIRNHELAPSQLSEIRGRGAGSLGLLIEREMAKTDPHFSWQQADADYNFSKSPGFQNTVRLMDSALNSIPRLQSSANTLAQGNVRSINSLIKLGKDQFNSVDLKRFQTDALLVGDEIGKIINGGGTGSGVSDAKLKQAQGIFKDSDSPKAIATALQEVQAIIGYRRSTMTRGTAYEGQAAQPEASGATHGIPDIGSTFNGGKVLKVTKLP
jgi:hypothetical protein